MDGQYIFIECNGVMVHVRTGALPERGECRIVHMVPVHQRKTGQGWVEVDCVNVVACMREAIASALRFCVAGKGHEAAGDAARTKLALVLVCCCDHHGFLWGHEAEAVRTPPRLKMHESGASEGSWFVFKQMAPRGVPEATS
jgi:hypothetical protein